MAIQIFELRVGAMLTFLTLLLMVPTLWAASASAGNGTKIGKRPGELYPDFCLPDLDGKIHRLSDYRGKKVFLFHFASW